jgi:hypothetical protein
VVLTSCLTTVSMSRSLTVHGALTVGTALASSPMQMKTEKLPSQMSMKP